VVRPVVKQKVCSTRRALVSRGTFITMLTAKICISLGVFVLLGKNYVSPCRQVRLYIFKNAAKPTVGQIILKHTRIVL
jgi:hypothetical protein